MKTDEIRAEIARLDQFESLAIPDGQEWFKKYATRMDNATQATSFLTC